MNGTPDMVTAGLKMIASLGAVLAVMFFLLYGIKKMTRQRLTSRVGRQIRVIESHYMGAKKNISLVHVPGRVLVVGVCGDNITLLDTLDESSVDPDPSSKEASAFGPMLTDRLKKIGSGFRGRNPS